MKLFYMRQLQSLTAILDFTQSVYDKNGKDTNNYLLCKKSASNTQKVLKSLSLAYFLIVVCYIIPSMVLSVLWRDIQYAMDVYPPGIDLNGCAQWKVMPFAIFNYLSRFGSLFGQIPFDTFIFVTFASIPMIVSVIIGQLQEFEMHLESGDCDATNVKFRIIQIVRMHQKYNE